MSDHWFSEQKKMSVERWANCHKKDFAHRSKRTLNLKERAFLAIRSLSDDTGTMLCFWCEVQWVLQPELPLDGSVLQPPMVPLYICSKAPVLPLDVSEHSKAACAASERVYPTAAWASSARFCSSVLQHTVLHLNVFVLAGGSASRGVFVLGQPLLYLDLSGL